ncbi:hypothetical protein T492DRAFT_842808 [Pavlovales sp. CCMP2436]|nr:hypothetical protein T492DRAFT_842808 [Pavlovales sp. CCMP2436]
MSAFAWGVAALLGAPAGQALQAPNTTDYRDLYTQLDVQSAYHNPNFALEVQLVPHVHKYLRVAGPSLVGAGRAISLGCSTGLGVSRLSKLGVDAFGVDVSDESVAIAKRLGRGDACSQPPCIQQASLLALPFPRDHFAVGFSADVLEHIAPQDVPAVISEITRVVTSALFLRVAAVQEFRKMKLGGKVVRLHLTTKGEPWWYAKFAAAGWTRMARSPLPRSNRKAVYLALERQH